MEFLNRPHGTFQPMLLLVGLLVAAGCSTTPGIYKMPPAEVESMRTGIGTVGVILLPDPAEVEVLMPARGGWGGFKRGVYVGATIPVIVGFVSPVPLGTLMGVMVAPFTAVIGGVYGAVSAVPAEQVEATEKRLNDVAAELRQSGLRDLFFNEVVRIGNERTGLKFVALSDRQSQDSTTDIGFSPSDICAVDAILDLKIENITYELRVWNTTAGRSGKLIYARKDLTQTAHRLERPLEPGSRYLWSVRAHFLLDGRQRTTEWSLAGYALRNEAVPNESCLRFRTPPAP